MFFVLAAAVVVGVAAIGMAAVKANAQTKAARITAEANKHAADKAAEAKMYVADKKLDGQLAREDRLATRDSQRHKERMLNDERSHSNYMHIYGEMSRLYAGMDNIWMDNEPWWSTQGNQQGWDYGDSSSKSSVEGGRSVSSKLS